MRDEAQNAKYSWCQFLQERLYAWLGGLRASNACKGLLYKLTDLGLSSQQRMKLEALQVRLLSEHASDQPLCYMTSNTMTMC